jgi:hypothetical protein
LRRGNPRTQNIPHAGFLLPEKPTFDLSGMDVSGYVIESAAFTRATLAGRWSRWLVFVLLGLPWMALSSLAGSLKIIEVSTVHWNVIPWDEAGLLIALGLLCNFLISGYIVRLLRGATDPPEFDDGLLLCLDGIKVQVIPLIWILVPVLLTWAQYQIGSGNLLPGSGWGSNLGTVLILLLLLVQIVIVYIAVQYGIIGAVRFARTGSVREAFSIIAIKGTLDRIGLVNYFVGLGVIVFAWLVFNYALWLLSLMPYAGPVIALCLGPFLTVFCARFIAHFCDEDLLPPGGDTGESGNAASPARIPFPWIIPELLAWLVMLAVLFVLCFTPLALVIGSLGRLWP